MRLFLILIGMSLAIYPDLAFTNDIVENIEFVNYSGDGLRDYFDYPNFIGKYKRVQVALGDNEYHLYCGKVLNRNPKFMKKLRVEISSNSKNHTVDAITIGSQFPMADYPYDIKKGQNYIFFVPKYLDIFWSSAVTGGSFIPEEGRILYISGLGVVEGCLDIDKIKNELLAQTIFLN